MKTPLLLTALLACVAAPAFAATPINETRPLDARGHVEVSNVKGRIEVRTWDKAEVAITGSLGNGAVKCAIPEFVEIAVVRADLINAFQHALHKREVFPGGTQCRKPG